MPDNAKIVLKIIYLIILPTVLIWGITRSYRHVASPAPVQVIEKKDAISVDRQIVTTHSEFADLAFVDSGHVWAADNNGNLTRFAGGQKFEGRFTSKIVSNDPSISFINSSIGWAFVPVETESELLKTSDGGKTWQLVSNEFGYGSLRLLHFVNEQSGWIQDNVGSLLRTGDGGKHWKRVFTGLYTAERLQNVAIVDAHTAVVVDVVGIHVTNDGGLNWDVRKISNSIRVVYAADRQNVWAIGEGNEVFCSSDAGQNWITLPMLDSHAKMVALQFINLREGWLVGSDRDRTVVSNRLRPWGVVFHTIDGGETWAPISVPEDSGFAKLGFSNARSGWLLGNEGLYETKDGGRTWATLMPELELAPATSK